MQNTADAETGPAVFLPTGKLVAFSAFGNLVLYTPGATPSSPGSWTLGPSAPPPSQPNDNPNHSQYTEDVPACIEPNGKVLFVSSDTIYGGGKFNEYDPVTNTVTAIAGPPVGSPTSYTMNFVALPTGQILLTGAGADYLYTPTGVPSDSWAPSIQSITANADGSYTLSGTQLNGLSQGASYGDEGNAQTNFPLVRLTQGSTVRYARTYAFSTMGFATGSTVVQTHFKLPAGLPNGTYQLSVVTNGIASPAVAFTVGQSNQPPTAAITAPANNATFTAPAQITINASASDVDGTISKVEFYGGTTLLGTDTTAPYSFVWSSVPVGSYSLTVKAYDNANAVTTSAAVNVVVSTGSNQPPTASITSPANNATFTAPAQITINANAADSDGTISKVEFYRGTTLLGTDTTAPYSFVWSNVAAGSYALTVKAYDNLNAVTTSSAINVVVNSAGTTPCSAWCTSPLVFSGPNYQSGNLGTGAVCRETTAVLHGGNCSNISGRTLTVNGVAMNCGGWTLPAPVNGGYCVQVTAGTPDYTSFATW
jgi:hypothetical protein